jgi:molecular chaperone GrpE
MRNTGTENGENENLNTTSDVEETTTEIAAEDISELEQVKRELADAEERAKDNLDKALRAMAEVANIRARAAKDVENAHKYGLEKFAEELLNVVDSLEHGLEAVSKASEQDGLKALHEGMELTHKLLISILEKFGIKQINPVGDKFDPAIHEALSMQETSECAPNHVLFVAQKGFMQSERVLRPARVIVAKA